MDNSVSLDNRARAACRRLCSYGYVPTTLLIRGRHRLRRRRSGVRRPRPRASLARRPGRHGLAPRAQRPSRDPFATVMIAMTSSNAGNTWSAGARPGDRNRRAERRLAQRPFAKGARTPFAKGVHSTRRQSALRPSACEGQGPASPRRETRRPPWRRPKAAADFAWLFDIVNRTRALLHPWASCPGCGAARSGAPLIRDPGCFPITSK